MDSKKGNGNGICGKEIEMEKETEEQIPPEKETESETGERKRY
jgi:hypothetical protein